MESTEKLQNDIFQGLQPLSFSALKEVKLFIDFIKIRENAFSHGVYADIDQELKSMNAHEANHLEQEFANYQEMYPRES